MQTEKEETKLSLFAHDVIFLHRRTNRFHQNNIRTDRWIQKNKNQGNKSVSFLDINSNLADRELIRETLVTIPIQIKYLGKLNLG